uniref:G-protein coupled receptors family 1 profile domain-containing protein n=1 Tax=Ascaris lumbricoides TaxID=6252 RepID=A0A9J2Q2L3_ASCLU
MDEDYAAIELNETESTSTAGSLFGVSLLQLIVSASAITLNTLVLIVGLLKQSSDLDEGRPSNSLLIHGTSDECCVGANIGRPLSQGMSLECEQDKIQNTDTSCVLVCRLLSSIHAFHDRVTNTLYMVIIPVGSLLIVLACNIALFISISRHAKVVATFENRRRINETQQLARATCIQAATPLFMQLPSLLGIFSIMGTDLTGSVLIWHLANLIWFLMLLNPLVDAIVTLVVVKAYRRAVRCLLISMVPRKILKYVREEKKRSTHAQSSLSSCKGRSQSCVVESRDDGQNRLLVRYGSSIRHNSSMSAL